MPVDPTQNIERLKKVLNVQKGDKGDKGDQGEPADEFVIGAILEHVNSPAPHPVYDDGPSLVLLYENAKV